MKQLYVAIAFLFSVQLTNAQWTKVGGIPSVHIVAMVTHNSSLYAASDSNIIYKTEDGLHWTSTNLASFRATIISMIFLNNTLYVGTMRSGIFSSENNGASWQRSANDIAGVSSFALRNGVLFAATLGDGVFTLDPNTNRWIPFNNALPTYSVNVWNIASTPAGLFIGAGSNGTFYRYNFTADQWHEEYYLGGLRPGLQIQSMIGNRDTLWAVNFGTIMRSNDAGLTWNGDQVGTIEGADRNIYAGSQFYYTITNFFNGGTLLQHRLKNAARGSTWATDQEFLPGGYSFAMIEFNNDLFLGKADGLYMKTPTGLPPPLEFVSMNLSCISTGVKLDWRTVRELADDHYAIQRSTDGIHFETIGSFNGNNTVEGSGYTFTDTDPVQDAVYRIVASENNGRVIFSSALKSSCVVVEKFSVWPNPFSDQIFIKLKSNSNTRLNTKIFDSKGALVDSRSTNIFKGNNQVSIATKLLATGLYHLYISSENAQLVRTFKLLKE